MPKDPDEFAELLGAKLIGDVPETGGGPFGMAHLAHIMHGRLTPSQGERPGRPTDAAWESRPKVPMSDETREQLEEIAKQVSTPERRVSPMQIAAQLSEEAVRRIREHSAAARNADAEARSTTESGKPAKRNSQRASADKTDLSPGNGATKRRKKPGA